MEKTPRKTYLNLNQNMERKYLNSLKMIYKFEWYLKIFLEENSRELVDL